jgi:hypothetical protein
MFHSGHLARTFRFSSGTIVVLHGWNNPRFHGDGMEKRSGIRCVLALLAMTLT